MSRTPDARRGRTSIYLDDVPNPFGLVAPAPWWLQPIADYDRELRIFPSQARPYFRLVRVGRNGAAGRRAIFERMPNLHPDTRICLQKGLVAVTTIPPGALHAPPQSIVAQLRARDLEGVDVDRLADELEAAEAAREAAIDRQNEQEIRSRARAMRIGWQYRTGSRASLVRPLTKDSAAPSPANPAASSGSASPAGG